MLSPQEPIESNQLMPSNSESKLKIMSSIRKIKFPKKKIVDKGTDSADFVSKA